MPPQSRRGTSPGLPVSQSPQAHSPPPCRLSTAGTFFTRRLTLTSPAKPPALPTPGPVALTPTSTSALSPLRPGSVQAYLVDIHGHLTSVFSTRGWAWAGQGLPAPLWLQHFHTSTGPGAKRHSIHVCGWFWVVGERGARRHRGSAKSFGQEEVACLIPSWLSHFLK